MATELLNAPQHVLAVPQAGASRSQDGPTRPPTKTARSTPTKLTSAARHAAHLPRVPIFTTAVLAGDADEANTITVRDAPAREPALEQAPKLAARPRSACVRTAAACERATPAEAERDALARCCGDWARAGCAASDCIVVTRGVGSVAQLREEGDATNFAVESAGGKCPPPGEDGPSQEGNERENPPPRSSRAAVQTRSSWLRQCRLSLPDQ